MSLNKRRY